MRPFAAAFVLGTLLLQRASELPEWRVALAGAAALLAAALFRQHVIARFAFAAVAGLALGYGYAAWRAELRLADQLPRAWEGRDIAVEGVVASLPRRDEKGLRFVLEVARVHTEGAMVPARISLTWHADSRQAMPAVAPGERWALGVRLRRPRGLANPHAFDFEPWALARGIRATGYVRAAPAPRRVGLDEGWAHAIDRWRASIRERMAAHLGEGRLKGVLVALAIGDQDAIAADDWDTFWRTGVGHLMSISGLHITMLAALGFAAARFAWVRVPALAIRWPARKAGVAVGTGVALGYALMTGFAVPAQRTFVMLAVVAACVWADRFGSASRVLALAAVAVVLADPWAAISPGFWLSFGAVAAIFYVMALRTGAAGRWRGAVAEQLAVTVAMVPMLVALFQEWSLVSPLANALAIPVVSLAIVPLSVVGAFLHAHGLLDVAHVLAVALMAPLEALADWPAAMVESHAPRPWTVAAALAGCAWLLAPRGVPLRSLGAVWMLPLVVVAPPAPAWGEAWVDVLDVGNGLAVVVRTASRALAYDAGPAWGEDSDSGGRIVVPYLRGEGVRRLDGLVVSHADNDHAGGAISLAAARAPPWLLSPLPAEHPLQLLFDVSRRCVSGQGWSWDGVRFEIVHPDARAYDEAPGRRVRRENDRSCVLVVRTAGAALLLAGDVESRAEAEMLARGEALRAEVLLVPHHGSKSSSTPAFLDAVAPAVAIASVGYRNRFGHPHESVSGRLAERGIALRRTDREGALRVRLPASTAAATVEPLVREVRYWSDRRPR